MEDISPEHMKGNAFLDESSLKKYFLVFRGKIRSLQKKIGLKKVVGLREIEGLRQIVYNSGNEAIHEIFGEGNLSEVEVEGFQDQLATEASKIGDVDTDFCSGQQLLDQLNHVTVLVRKIAVESDKRELKKYSAPEIMAEKIIPLTFKDRDVYITVGDFFSLPLASEKAETPFQQHYQYLQKLMGEGKLSQSDFNRLEESGKQFPKYRFKKTFNLFKRGRFNTTVLGAVYEVLETGKLKSLIQ